MEGVNAAGKRVSLLNDELPGVGARGTAALPYHSGPPARPKVVAPVAASRPPLDAWNSNGSSRSSSSTTSTSTTASTTSSSSLLSLSSQSSAHILSHNSSSSSSSTNHHHHHHHHGHHHDPDSHYSPRDSRHSSTSVTSPHFSPASRHVPQLLRHDSTSSSQSLNTPSPMTPTTMYEPLDHQGKGSFGGDPSAYPFLPNGHLAMHQASQQAGLGAMPTAAAYYPTGLQASMAPSAAQGMYPTFASLQQPMLGDPFGMPAAPAMQFQFATELIDTSAPPASLVGTSLTPPNGLAANGQPAASDTNSSANGSQANGSTTQKAKKKYPCPYAQRYNCTDTFTTSGHAARHGKKHTGEKNILCPTCHKAFTRKDNMKQHERTHKNRNNNSVDETKSMSGNSRRTQSISSVTASTLTSKSSNGGSTTSTEMDVDSSSTDGTDSKRSSMQRPSLNHSTQYLGGGVSLGNGGDVKADHSLHAHRPELNRQFSGESQDGEGESPGLDALAMAASELR